MASSFSIASYPVRGPSQCFRNLQEWLGNCVQVFLSLRKWGLGGTRMLRKVHGEEL